MCKVLKTDVLNLIKQSKIFFSNNRGQLFLADAHGTIVPMVMITWTHRKIFFCSYLLLLLLPAEEVLLEEVRTQLKWREKSRHQAVAEWFHLVLLRSFSLQFSSLSSTCRSVTFHQSCSIILTFLLLFFHAVIHMVLHLQTLTLFLSLISHGKKWPPE